MATHAPARVTRQARAQLLHGVYPIVNEGPRTLELARAVLDAGAHIVQYRAKNGLNAQHLRALRAMTHDSDALLILNDDWRAALAFECDGVHLGPGDDGFSNIASVRGAMPHHIVGVSCGTSDEVRRANEGDADYLGIGAVFATQSKADAGVPIGVAGLTRLARDTRLAVAAIGGITVENIEQIRSTGVAMAAVISAIAASTEPRQAAAALIARWNIAR